MRWENSRAGLVLLGLLVLGACEYQDLIDSDPESVQIALSPRAATLEALGDTVRISAEVSVDGVPVPSAPLSWRSLNPDIATVDRNGKVVAVRPGTAEIEVSVSSRSETATITVQQKVTSLFVIPLGVEPGGSPPPGDAVATIDGVGDSLRFAAVARDRNGNEVVDPRVEWSSLDPSVAAVSEEGVVRGVGIGMTQIIARAGAVSDTVSVIVQSAVATLAIEPERGTLDALGDTLRLKAVARDGKGNVVGDAVIAWKSLAPSIVSVDDSGLATARANGEAQIVASTTGAADTVTVAVAQRPAAVTIEPNPVTITIGSTAQLAATAIDANGHAIEGASISWSSSDRDVVSVDGSGVVRGVAAGKATITARAGNRAASVSVTVSPTPVGSVSVSPAQASIPAGTTIQLTAEVKDAGGKVLDGRPVTWSSSDTDIATVSASGLVTGVAPGKATITAASDGKSGSAQVTITTSPSSRVARVEISPSADTLDALGSKVQFAARAYDGDGDVLSDARIVWTSLHPNIATVDSMGIVTARAVGAALIVAAAPCCGKADTAGVVVRQVVTSVSVSPSSRSIAVNESYRLDASAKDANRNAVPDAKFSWTSSNSSIARVDATGLVTGVASGNATITVTSNGKSASAQISVTGGGGSSGGSASLVNECSRPQSAWIWCDDFDQDRTGQYFEYDSRGGRFVRATGVGVGGSGAMRARFNAGDINAGSLKLAFGRTPDSYFRPVDNGTANYRELYWRFYLRNAPGWTGGGGDKLARAVVFAGSNWSEALVAHLWSGGSGSNYLVIDPVSGTDAQGNLRTTRYNDFGNFRWLGARTSSTPIFDAAHVGQWYCVETRVRVNDPGQSNGIFELWIDGDLEARVTNLNWVGSYNAYGINALFLENYWNDGSPRQQERYFDNLVVSTQRIGCGGQSSGGSDGGNSGGGTAPAPVATVAVSPSSGTIQVQGTLQLTATPRDQNGNALSGRTITWSSSNTSVATVTSTGLVRGVGPGSATIRATSEGKSGTMTVTVTQQHGSGSVQPWLVEDFSTYTSTEHLRSDPRGIYGTRIWGDKGAQYITLDTSTGYGASTRSMKYTFPNRTNSSSRCQDFSISRDLLLPSYVPNRLSGEREIWIEVVAKFSPNFRTRAPASWNCNSAPDYKWIFATIFNGGRFELKIGQQGSRFTIGGPPGNTIEDVIHGYRAEDYWDGQWHVYRLHFKFPSSPTAADGALEAWIDGKKVYSRTNLTAASQYANDRIYSIALGANLNQGPAEEMALWWSRIAIWRENPGW